MIISFFKKSQTFSFFCSPFFTGSAIKCFKEGETVKVSFINNDPCIECKCLNQEIVCKREQCSIVKNCYLLNHNANLTCCNSCKGCHFQDVYYQSGSTWTHPKYSCIKYICAVSLPLHFIHFPFHMAI